MTLPFTIISVLVIFALLIGVGVPAATAMQRARQGQLTDADIAQLPLTDHALKGHKGQLYTAEIIQELTIKGFCSPKIMYLNCKDHTVLFACKPNRASTNNTYALLIIGLAGWKPSVTSGYAIDGRHAQNGEQ